MPSLKSTTTTNTIKGDFQLDEQNVLHVTVTKVNGAVMIQYQVNDSQYAQALTMTPDQVKELSNFITANAA